MTRDCLKRTHVSRYTILLFGTLWRSFWQLRQTSLTELPSIFILSLAFLSLVRTVAFLSLGVVSALWADQELGSVGALYSESTQALISVGDSVFVSLYLLLVGLWFEAQAAIRRHLMHPDELRAIWLTFWLVANSILYALQIILFVAIFATNDAHSKSLLLVSVHAITAAVSFALPILVVVVFLVSQAAFSGYPWLKTPALASRTRNLTLALGLWSLGRLAWGGLGVAEALGWENALTGPGGTWRYALTIAAVFIVGELLPATQALMGLGVGSAGVLGSAPDEAVAGSDGSAGAGADQTGGQDGAVTGSQRGGGLFAGAGGALPPPHKTARRRRANGGASHRLPSMEEGASAKGGRSGSPGRRGRKGAWVGLMHDPEDAEDEGSRPEEEGEEGEPSSIVGWVASGLYRSVFGGARRTAGEAQLLREDSDESSTLSLTGSINHARASLAAEEPDDVHGRVSPDFAAHGTKLPAGVEAKSPVANALRADADNSADGYLQF